MTTLISYTLRETQNRMLRFTYQLQYHITHDMPYWTIVFSHVTGMYVCMIVYMRQWGYNRYKLC